MDSGNASSPSVHPFAKDLALAGSSGFLAEEDREAAFSDDDSQAVPAPPPDTPDPAFPVEPSLASPPADVAVAVAVTENQATDDGRAGALAVPQRPVLELVVSLAADDTDAFAPDAGAPVASAAAGLSQSQIDRFESRLPQALASIDADVAGQVYAETLPLLGDNLTSAAAGGSGPLHFAKELGAAIASGLGTLNGSASYSAAQVQSAIDAALATAGFAGAGVTVDLSDAGDVRLSFAIERSGAVADVALAEDLGLPNLGLHVDGSAQAALEFGFAFVAGIDATGFYLDTGAGAANFSFGLDVQLDSLGSVAEMGKIPFTVLDRAADPTRFSADFTLELVDPGGDARLRPDEFGGALIDATLTGGAGIRLDLDSALPTAAAMPQFGTDLTIAWSFDAAQVDPGDDNSAFGAVPEVVFANNTLNLGSFFDHFAGSVLAGVSRVTGPMQPLIDILTQPIPILNDLGSHRVTLLDFAGLDPEETSAIEGLSDIVALTSKVATYNSHSGVQLDLGSLRVDADLRSDSGVDAALAVARTPAAFELQNVDVGEFLEDVSNVGGGGLHFPLITEQDAIGRLFLGQDLDLFEYRTSFGFDEEFSQYFPVLGFAGVTLGGHFGMSANFEFGFDAQGVRDFHAGGSTDPALLWNGYYVRASDDGGAPVTGFSIDAGITAGMEANLLIATAGVEGDLTATIDFGLDETLDPDGDGKVRGNLLDETAVDQLFNASGRLTSGLRAYVEVGIGWFSNEFSFDSPRVTLISFDGDGDNPPVLANELGNGDLALNVGPRSAARLVGNLEDVAEKIAIATERVFDLPVGLRLAGFGVVQDVDFAPHLTASGGLRGDELVMESDVEVAAVFHGGAGRDLLAGGAAADWLSGDDGHDQLLGRGGNDTLAGGVGNDHLTGGAGADSMDGGDGVDTVSWSDATTGMTIDLRTMTFTGDGASDVLTSIERFEGTNHADTIHGRGTADALLGGLGGNDTIFGYAGNDVLDGGDGIDLLRGGEGNDYLAGGAGADTLDGGNGIDTLSYVGSQVVVAVSLASGTGSAGDATGDVLTGFEALIGSPLPFGDLRLRMDSFGRPVTAGTGDTLLGASGNETISGLGGADSIAGNDGDDLLWGDLAQASRAIAGAAGFDCDTLAGGAGNDTLHGQSDADDLDAGAGNDSLGGGDGDDHLRTLDPVGLDTLDGGPGTNRLSADYSDKTVVIDWIAGQNNDYVFADGDREINFQNVGELHTADLDDTILLDGVADDGYANRLYTNGGHDLVRSGAGNDSVEGGAGNDTVFGGGSGDTIAGGSGDDYINGGDHGTRLLFDPVFGSITGWQGVEGDRPDELHGGDGVDTLVFDGLSRYVIYLGSGDDYGKAFQLGVSVNLATNETGLAATGTVISGFENVVGTNSADNLVGNESDNVFSVLRGGGRTSGSTGGPDYIDGAGGTDTLVIDMSVADLEEAPGASTNGEWISRTGFDTWHYVNVERLHVTGASKADLLYAWAAGANADFFSGLDGNDTLGGKGGSDTLLGGDGDDRLSAQGTFDLYREGTAGGSDLLEGGDGDDIIEDVGAVWSTSGLAADAHFRIDGGSGFDTLSVDFSNQGEAIVWSSLSPGDIEFADGAYARNFERLWVFGSGSGDDDIRQYDRVDNAFYLGAGNDTVDPGLGHDQVNGGEGEDLLILDFSVGDNDAMRGVEGSGGVFIRPTVADYFDRPDTIGFSGFERLHITATSKDDAITAGYGNDTLIGGAGNDWLDGASGGNNSIDGGAGNDTLRGSYGINSSGRDDTLAGGGGNDSLLPLSGNDSVLGGDGNDTIAGEYWGSTSEFGSDHFHGGAGDDVMINVIANGGYGYALAGDRMMFDGGSGTDTISADFSNQTQAIVFVGGQSNSIEFDNGSYLRNFEVLGTFLAGSGDDSLTQPGRRATYLGGSGGNDTLAPGVGFDDIFGGAGDDLLVVDYASGDTANVSGVDFDGRYLWRKDLDTDTVLDRLSFQEIERVSMAGGGKGDRLIATWGNDTLAGRGGDDTLTTSYGNDSIDGGSGDDSLAGEVHADTLVGATGADTLDGGQGDDSLSGGAGDDVYRIDSALDVTREAVGRGTDTVEVVQLDAFTLGPNFENLVLNSSGNPSGRGNSLANRIVGQGGNNLLEGLDGADTLDGGAGNDTLSGGAGVDRMAGGPGDDLYRVGAGAEVVTEALDEGIDTVDSTALAFTLPDHVEHLYNRLTEGSQTGNGNALDNILSGAAANDRLSGLGGNDSLAGGTGADTLAGGDDNDTLGGGAGNDSLAGGNGDDSLAGSDGADTLHGGAGADALRGGAGDDDYLGVGADGVADTVYEQAGEGYDRVFASASHTLGANLEYLQLNAGASGIGNALANTLIGNTAANTLKGLDGADRLDGREGSDRLYAGVDAFTDVFVFASALSATGNVDTLYEFAPGEDRIELSATIFGALRADGGGTAGVLATDQYFAGAGLTGAGTADAAGVWHDTSTGRLYYNPTATGADSVLFAVMAGGGAGLASGDFVLAA